ncbi:unnamed protein product [Trichogramma brassicae]|uniref:Peptidase aspartic putative domain-containing protein n=1 Tax=Trichogramma brassicae TaxID=86971 RepID=A0A6H5IN95_9HYME|nr:unnamed protein product [Trichogramma brassicae]
MQQVPKRRYWARVCGKGQECRPCRHDCPLPTPSMSPLPTERQDARKEPPPSTITFQEYIAAAKELQLHQRILLHLADRRLRNYLRAAPTPPPSPKRNALALTPSAAQPADPSGSTPPVWRLIRLDTPPPPQKPRLDPRLRPTDPRRYRAPLNGAQTPPLPEEIEREQRRKATHHQLALFIAKHPQPARSAPKKPPPTKLSLLRKQLVETLKALCETITTTPRESWSLGTGQAHYELLEAYWDDFQHNHGNLWNVDPIESGYQRSDIYATVEGAYTMAKGQLYDIQQRLRSAGCYLPAASASHATPAVATQSYQRLPQINVPEFSGRREDWEGFRDLFTALIHQAAHLTDVERLYYLKTLVKGEAKVALESLQLMSSNYETAWALLLNRYDNRRLLVHDHLVALRAIKPLRDASVRSFQGLIGTLSRHRDQLRSLDCPVDQWDDWFVSIAASCMDLVTRQAWEAELERLDALESTNTEGPPGQRLPSFTDLNAFLNGRCRMAVACSSTMAIAGKSSSQPGGERTARSFVTRQVNNSCAQCSGDHYVGHCTSFTNLEPKDRKNLGTLPGSAHRDPPVKYAMRCITLCCTREAPSAAPLTMAVNLLKTTRMRLVTQEDNRAINPAAGTVNSLPSRLTVLPTALVRISGPQRQIITVRSLFDNCSEVSLIAHALALKLQAPIQEVNTEISVIGGGVAQRSQRRITIHLHLPGARTPITIEASCLRHLGITTPAKRLPLEAVPTKMRGVLADPHFYKPGSVDLLLGANVLPSLMREGLQQFNGLIAQNTLAGWIVWGSFHPRPMIESGQ